MKRILELVRRVARVDTTVLVTCATPVPLKLLAKLGLGRDRLADVSLEGKSKDAELS